MLFPGEVANLVPHNGNVAHIYAQHESGLRIQIMKVWYMKWDRKKPQASCLGLFFSKLRQAQIRTSRSQKFNNLA